MTAGCCGENREFSLHKVLKSRGRTTSCTRFFCVLRLYTAEKVTYNKNKKGGIDRCSYVKLNKEYRDLEQIVEAAAFAPSWKNSQTVRYIAVEDAALKERIATEATMNFTHNKDIISACPVLIVVVTKTGICGYEKDGSYTTSKKDKWEMFDAGIASQTFMLAAHEYGVGTVTLGIFDEEILGKILELPEGDNVSALLAAGYPESAPAAPKKKSVEELLSWR